MKTANSGGGVGFLYKSLSSVLAKTTSKLRQKQIEQKTVVIAAGKHLVIPVYGEHYAQKGKQKAIVASRGVKNFTLTPQCRYQAENGWPEMPFCNVNVCESLETTENNWIGYIAPPLEIDNSTQRERSKYIKKLIAISAQLPVMVEGKVIDERDSKGSFQMLIFASRKSIDEAYDKYVKNSLR